jgi:hypothetical protein
MMKKSERLVKEVKEANWTEARAWILTFAILTSKAGCTNSAVEIFRRMLLELLEESYRQYVAYENFRIIFEECDR